MALLLSLLNGSVLPNLRNLDFAPDLQPIDDLGNEERKNKEAEREEHLQGRRLAQWPVTQTSLMVPTKKVKMNVPTPKYPDPCRK